VSVTQFTFPIRLQALEDSEDVQASQASRLTDLERQVFLLQAKRISELEARIAELERTRRRRRKPSPTENATGGHHPDEPICMRSTKQSLPSPPLQNRACTFLRTRLLSQRVLAMDNGEKPA